jgi:hypothetical protein
MAHRYRRPPRKKKTAALAIPQQPAPRPASRTGRDGETSPTQVARCRLRNANALILGELLAHNRLSLNVLQDRRSHIFGLANEFYCAWHRCQENVPLSPNVFQPLTWAAATCGALSIELHLKLLLVLSSRTFGNEHDLWKLFERLPPNIKDSAIARYKTIAPWGDLEKILRETSNYFVTRRYVYEMLPPPGGSFSTEVYSLGGVIRSLHDTARELDPGLRINGDDSRPFPIPQAGSSP